MRYLLLFFCISIFGQSVPDTNTFSLNDVRTVIGLPATASLVQCFANADDAGFDPTYEESKNSLLNFRNYEKQASNILFVSPTGGTTGYEAGSTQLFVDSNTDWSATSNAAWLTISPDPRTGSGNANFTVNWTQNNGTSSRNGSIAITTTSGTPSRFATFFLIQNPEPMDPVTLAAGIDGNGACNAWDNGITLTRYIPDGESFTTATLLFSDENGSTLASAAYYSNGSISRQWNGTAFVGGSTQNCP